MAARCTAARRPACQHNAPHEDFVQSLAEPDRRRETSLETADSIRRCRAVRAADQRAGTDLPQQTDPSGRALPSRRPDRHPRPRHRCHAAIGAAVDVFDRDVFHRFTFR